MGPLSSLQALGSPRRLRKGPGHLETVQVTKREPFSKCLTKLSEKTHTEEGTGTPSHASFLQVKYKGMKGN